MQNKAVTALQFPRLTHSGAVSLHIRSRVAQHQCSECPSLILKKCVFSCFLSVCDA